MSKLNVGQKVYAVCNAERFGVVKILEEQVIEVRESSFFTHSADKALGNGVVREYDLQTMSRPLSTAYLIKEEAENEMTRLKGITPNTEKGRET